MGAADFLGRGVGGDFAGVDDDGALGVVLRLGQVVGGEEDRLAFRGLGAHELPELLAHGGVHTGGRLVEDDEFGVGQEGKCEADALLLAAGELANLAREEVSEVGLVNDGVDGFFALVDAGEELEEFCDGVVIGQCAGLQHDSHEAATNRFLGAHAENFDRAAIGLLQAQDDVDRRALSCAIAAQECDDFAGIDAHVDSFEGLNLPVGFDEAFGEDRRCDGVIRVRVHASSQPSRRKGQQWRLNEVSHDTCHEIFMRLLLLLRGEFLRFPFNYSPRPPFFTLLSSSSRATHRGFPLF